MVCFSAIGKGGGESEEGEEGEEREREKPHLLPNAQVKNSALNLAP